MTETRILSLALRLSDSYNFVDLAYVVLSQYQCVTDRQRDGRSDDSQYISLHNNVC